MRTKSEILHTPAFARKVLPVVISAALSGLALPAIAATPTPQTTASTAKTGDTITIEAAPQTFKSGGNDTVPAYLD